MSQKPRARGGRLSLNAFEAEWLWLILDTCIEIAIDTLPFVETPPPPNVREDPADAFDDILRKLSKVTPA